MQWPNTIGLTAIENGNVKFGMKVGHNHRKENFHNKALHMLYFLSDIIE
jgi:hypothetical protein